MTVTVYKYGRWDHGAGQMAEVVGRYAAAEKIEALNAEMMGAGVEVSEEHVEDGWLIRKVRWCLKCGQAEIDEDYRPATLLQKGRDRCDVPTEQWARGTWKDWDKFMGR